MLYRGASAKIQLLIVTLRSNGVVEGARIDAVVAAESFHVGDDSVSRGSFAPTRSDATLIDNRSIVV